MLSSDERTAFVFGISIPWTPSERDGYDVCDTIPIQHARLSGIVSVAPDRRRVARLLALTDTGRPIPVGSFAGAGSAGGYLAVLADGRRLPARGAFGAAREYLD